ncbi:MAG: M15 family metallopeptidase [Hyphomicrobiales bacterium]|nr:M15 family metallopeptidase [Hyphomicrobiales bacterium]
MSTAVSKDLKELAPKFAQAVQEGLDAARKAGLEAMVFEAFRSDERQRFLYRQGRTIIPPKSTVTNAPTADYSWHGYGLAVDVVHQTKFWEPVEGEKWFKKVADIFKQHACSWGGDWKKPDTPHFQWHLCKPSPSEIARDLKRREGAKAVWKVVQAV